MKSYSNLLLAMVVLWIGSAANARYSGGTGAPNDPYRIATAADLNDIGNYEEDWNKHFILVNDVNLAEYTGTQFKIIGRWIPWTGPNNPFTGVFDGNGHKIWNFTWRSDANGIGLFGYVGSGGQIKNLGMENVDVNAGTGCYVGGLVGMNWGTIINCYSSGSVVGVDSVGGLVGEHYGTITNCYSTDMVSGDEYVGGLVGYSSDDGAIFISYSTGSVSGIGYVGGLVGNGGTISNCYSTGRVTGTWYVGGLVGVGRKITDCYSLSAVSGKGDVGGLVGRNPGGTISNSYSIGSVSTDGNGVGGLLGRNEGTITNCYSTGSVNGTNYVGGLVGDNWPGTITNCYSLSNVNGEDYVGGLVGFNYPGSSGINNATITECYSTGNVLGRRWVGGVAGYNYKGDIANCYAAGTVSGFGMDAGGLVGHNGGTIDDCYSTAAVDGSDYVGGLVGHNLDTVSDSFWDVDTSGQSTSAGGTGKTTEEMKTKSTFTNAGWDFVNIWDICEGTNYPRLRWQIPLAISMGDFVCPYGVNFIDFAVLSSAWQTEPNDASWNATCDISQPKDNFIDELDLAIFCENWLEEK